MQAEKSIKYGKLTADGEGKFTTAGQILTWHLALLTNISK